MIFVHFSSTRIAFFQLIVEHEYYFVCEKLWIIVDVACIECAKETKVMRSHAKTVKQNFKNVMDKAEVAG